MSFCQKISIFGLAALVVIALIPSPAEAQTGKLALKKLTLNGYGDRNAIHDWVATKSTLSVLIGSDVLDRTVADERVIVGTHKLKPAGGITAFKGQMEVEGYPLVRAAWPEGGTKGLIFIAAGAPLSSSYLFEDEIYVATLTAKGAFKGKQVVFRVPYQSGGFHTFAHLVAAHGGDRAAIAFSYYRTVPGSYQWTKTWFVELTADGAVLGSPVEIVRESADPVPALAPLALYPAAGGWRIAFSHRPDGNTVSVANDYREQLHTCFVPGGANKPATVTAGSIEAWQGNGYVWYSAATYLPEFGKSRAAGLFFVRDFGEPNATTLRVPPYQSAAAIAPLNDSGAFAAAPTVLTLARWEKEQYIYSLTGPNTLLGKELFSNVARGQGYTYLVAQARHGKHSTWPNGGSENDPEQQYNLYQVDGRTGAATKLAKADYRWKTGQDSRNLTQFLFLQIVRFGTKTGILLQSQFGSGEEILYALY